MNGEYPENAHTQDPILEEARGRFGIQALFPFQRLVIQNILEAADLLKDPGTDRDGRNRQIVILPTGAGKSLCFMLPGALLPGITLVVFPLLALMGDQLRRLEEAGLPSVILRGSQTREGRGEIWRKIASGEIRFILTNPETLKTEEVRRELTGKPLIHGVIDEAHTVNEWGKTFRPAYLELGECLKALKIPILTAFTATASPEVLRGIRELLFPQEHPHLIMGNPDRENISYRVVPTLCPEADLARFLLPRRPDGTPNPEQRARPALVFCSSRTSAEMTARELRARSAGDREIFYYHAGLTREEKTRIEAWFFDSPGGILCSTCAYGMGVDKQNIRTVIHRDPPSTVEAYLQESGRGGRDRGPAEAILLLPEGYAGAGRPVPPGQKPQEETAVPVNPPLDNAGMNSRETAFVSRISDSTLCRREGFLSLLGMTAEYCSGCDVCRGDIQKAAGGVECILNFLKVNPGRYDKRQIRFLLAGRGSSQILEEHLYRNRFFGALDNWLPDDIARALETLGRTGLIRQRGKRGGKQRYYPGRKKT